MTIMYCRVAFLLSPSGTMTTSAGKFELISRGVHGCILDCEGCASLRVT
jgi:hypothetical protein